MLKIGIRKKIFFLFSLLFIITSCITYYMVDKALTEKNETIITNELKQIQRASREYIKQYVILNGASEALFHEHGSTLAQDLSQHHQKNVALYDQEGNFLYEALDNPALVTLPMKSDYDFHLALENKAAYILERINSHQSREVYHIVHFSFPLYIQDQYYGIIRLSKDYSPLYEANRFILRSFSIFIVIMTAGILFLIYIISTYITKPLLRLTTAMKDVTKGQYNVAINNPTGDEIEELTNSFSEMQLAIKEHIKKVEFEKEKVIQLEESRRHFFNNVTHELKTPLTTISGFAQIIGEKGFHDPVFLEKAARKIKNESERLHQLVLELLDIAKHQANLTTQTAVEKVDLLAILNETIEELEWKAKAYEKTIVQHNSDTPLYVKVNANQMKQVFINIMDNAIKYGKIDSVITVKVQQDELMIKTIVSNESEPWEKDLQMQAFEPFVKGQQAINDKESRGLGLYICKMLVENNYGTITLSTGNEKTAVEICFLAWQ